MKKTNEPIIVNLAKPERKFVKVYHDFLQNELLTTEEKMVFIVLKSFVDFSKDNGGVQGEAYPGMDTVCKLSSLSRPRATRAINSLIKKKIVTKVRQGLTKPNIYTLSDYSTMWTCDNEEDMAAAADNLGADPSTPEEHIKALEQMGYEVQVKDKEKELAGATSKEHTQANNNNKNKNLDVIKDTTSGIKSQAERYTMEDLKILYEYSTLIIRYPEKKTDIDIVLDILYETLNSTKPYIRVNGEDKPTMAVVGKLMKLEADDLIYSIDKFHEQTDLIKNVKSYLLTILYNSHEQNHLNLMNLGHHNGDF